MRHASHNYWHTVLIPACEIITRTFLLPMLKKYGRWNKNVWNWNVVYSLCAHTCFEHQITLLQVWKLDCANTLRNLCNLTYLSLPTSNAQFITSYYSWQYTIENGNGASGVGGGGRCQGWDGLRIWG